MIGTRIAHYEITAKLGEGGMGVVYRARDTKLNRDVAIKVLPGALTHDHNRMDRFRREAQLLAQLNHPAIAGIHGVEESNGQYALVMELAEGIDLAKRLDSGAIPIDEALPIARQIAEAVEAAHEKGIIHRDLKPANIKVSEDGSVKVLDFGLAKALEGEPGSATDAEQSPTLTMGATQTGVIMGTAAYMSPEQARGKTAGKRADIWSFGVVLYEMLTGRQLFGGETVSDSLAGVLKSDINFKHLPAGTPVSIHRLLRRCLERDRKRRLQAVGEARIAIEEQLAEPAGASVLTEAPPIAPQARRRRVPAWVAGVLGVVAAGLAVALWQASRPVEQPLMQFDISIGPDLELGPGWGANTIISPGGSRLVFSALASDGQVRLYTRRLDQHQTSPLDNTEGASAPFFSPDGNWVAFYADGMLRKISVNGGAPITLCDAVSPFMGGSWGDDGSIIASLNPRGPLSRVPSAGGAVEPVTELKSGAETAHRWPQILPGGKAVLFTAGIAGSINLTGSVEVLNLKSGQRKTLQPKGYYGRYLPSGHLVYVHQGTLFAAPMDLERLVLTGPPAPVLEEVAYHAASGGSQFAFSQSGTFAYLRRLTAGSESSVSWLDSAGRVQPLVDKPGVYSTPRLSPDGRYLALTALKSEDAADVWIYDLQRETMSRLTFAGNSRDPVWTPDGQRVAFQSRRENGQWNLGWKNADGSGETQRLTASKDEQIPYSFSPDGRWLAYQANSDETSWNIWTLPLKGDEPHGLTPAEPGLFIGTPFNEQQPVFSPDGDWLAYTSDESGTSEVYVQPFPGPGAKLLISTGGGTRPMWSSNGRELFYLNARAQIEVVSYTIEGSIFSAGKPRQWSQGALPGWVDLAPDGERFVVLMAGENTVEEQTPPTQVTFLLNFFDELMRRVPAEP